MSPLDVVPPAGPDKLTRQVFPGVCLTVGLDQGPLLSNYRLIPARQPPKQSLVGPNWIWPA